MEPIVWAVVDSTYRLGITVKTGLEVWGYKGISHMLRHN